MPELPEVETIRRQIGPAVAGRRVLEAWAFPSAKFTPATDLIGATLGGARRRGKYLLFPTDDGRELVAHLGMTGSFSFTDEPEPSGAHLRAWWRLGPAGAGDGGTGNGTGGRNGAATTGPAETLRFDDTRRFGRLRVVPAGHYDDIATLSVMGPEPLDPDFTAAEFTRLLARSRRRLKTSLLSQRPVAGIGNIYADEALWLAEINPKVRRLGTARAARLLDALRRVLEQGIDNGGTTLRDYRNVDGEQGSNQHGLVAYGRGGQPCRRCGRPLRADDVDGRTTTWCPHCQAR
ncbi:MAG: bifunctional DNA-formamidopyrimidine glycosylase/DNA-(apurinic or apyrimidinic site) lyase [Actinomycetota bacterium]